MQADGARRDDSPRAEHVGADEQRALGCSAGRAPANGGCNDDRAAISLDDARLVELDGGKADAAPAGFSFGRTGNGKEGRWVAQPLTDAPSKIGVWTKADPVTAFDDLTAMPL